MKDLPRNLTTETALPSHNQSSTSGYEFPLPRRSASLDRGSLDRSASRSFIGGCVPTPRSSEVWLDQVVRTAASPTHASITQRFNVDILLAGAAPVSVMLIYLGASLIRAIALFLTPVMLLSPLYPLYRASWSTGMKFLVSGVYTSLMMMLNAFGIVSFPLYFLLEAVPQIVTTTFYFMVFSPGLVLAAVALTLMHRFRS